jgi:glycosyltransferase involved in cell wall biosynthesis
VIPTLGRPDALPRTLAALEGQTTAPGSFEVIVVADANEDIARVESDIGTRSYPVRRLQGERPGASSARNAGWRAAEAPIVLFIGDDIVPDPGMLEQHLLWHRREGDERVGVLGHVRWAEELRRSAFMVWLDEGIQFDYESITGTEAGPGHFYTSNVSVARAMLERTAGFDEERFPFGYEDIDLGMRLFDAGLRLLYNAEARAQHLHEPRLEHWRSRMITQAQAERAWIERYPGEKAYFRDLFEWTLDHPEGQGRIARLLRWIPRGTPLVGEVVWKRADFYFRRQLAEPFMRGWDAHGDSRSAHG